MSESVFTKPTSVAHLQKLSAVIGIVGIAVLAIVGSIQHEMFFRAYMFGWLFWLGVPLGGSALMALHCLVGGHWGRLVRPVASAAALCLPLNAILFLPIFFGLRVLFPWARAEEVAHDAILTHKAPWMNVSMFAIRYVIYFVVWTALTYAAVKTADAYDKNKSPATYERLNRISWFILVCFVALMTFAGVDWVMSREAHWFSSISGFIHVIDQARTAMLTIVIVLYFQMKSEPVKSFGKPHQFNDIGNLMLTLTILWAYMNFAQFLIMWTGNEQDDVVWYVQRSSGMFFWIASFLIVFHFFVPFFALLSRDIKRDINKLFPLACGIFIVHAIYYFWQLAPVNEPDVHKGWINPILFIFAWFGIGGIFVAVFLSALQKRPLLPTPFPEELEKEAMNHGHHHAPNPG